MRFSEYPAYINSAVEWLGMIPVHWKISRLKNYVRMRYGDALVSDIRENGDISVYGSNGPVGTHARPNTCAPAIIVGRKGSYGKIVWAENGGFVIDTAYAIDNSETSQNIRWLYYVLQILGLDSLSQDTGVPGLSRDKAYQLQITIPPLNEQGAIANFLDRETARIDKLIAEKQTFIKLLKEKRQALISQAFRSDNSVARAKLGFFVDLLPGYAFKSEFFSENDSDIRLLRGTNVGVGSLKWDDVVYWSSDNDSDVEAFALKEGDIVFGMDRPWISAGARVAIVERGDLPCYLVQRVAKIRAKNGFNQKYIYYALASEEFKFHAEADLTGLSVPHISPDQIKSFRLPILSENDQNRLVEKIERETDKIQRIIKEVEESITLASEHRTALISAAVTGKIDVRNQ